MRLVICLFAFLVPVVAQPISVATADAEGANDRFSRDYGVACDRLWNSAISKLDEVGFDPENLDRASLFGRFNWRKGAQVWGRGAGDSARKYTEQDSNFFDSMQRFEVQYGALSMLDTPTGCTVTLRFAYQGLKRGLLLGYRWLQLTSSGFREQQILSQLMAAKAPADTSVPVPAEPEGNFPHVSFTSNPEGAEIEVGGVFFGNTPSAKDIKSRGMLSVVMRKRGYATWKRAVEVSPGDVLTIHADLEPIGNDASGATAGEKAAPPNGIKISGL